MNKYITIADRKIGPTFSPYVIAEMSANHNGNLQAAFNIIEQAKKAGADALKIQTYRPDTITLDSNLPDFQIKMGYGQVEHYMNYTNGPILPLGMAHPII